MGPDAMILVFWMPSFKPVFSLFYFTFIKRPFSSYSLSAIRVVSSAYGGKMETVMDFIFLSSKITVDGDWSHETDSCSLEEKLWQT